MSKLSKSEAGRLGGLIASHRNSQLKIERIQDYDNNPIKCATCQSAIPYSKRVNKFCSHSCRATLINQTRTTVRLKCSNTNANLAPRNVSCAVLAPRNVSCAVIRICRYCALPKEGTCSKWCSRPQLYKSLNKNFNLNIYPYIGTHQFIPALEQFVHNLTQEYASSSLPLLAAKYNYTGHILNFSKLFKALGINLKSRKQAINEYFDRNGLRDHLTEKDQYYNACQFEFRDYSNIEGYHLVKQYGWYHPVNNPKGVSRDHMFSVSEGFKQSVPTEVIRHPANCRIIIHTDNSSKGAKCSITLDELKHRMEEWCRMSDSN